MTSPEDTFLSAVAAHADATPDRLAVKDDRRSWSYAELAAAVTVRSAELRAAGLVAGDRIMVVAENSGDFLVTATAIWTLGGVLVTVYPSSGRSELEFCLATSDPALALVSPHLLEAALSVAGQVPIFSIELGAEIKRTRRGSEALPQDAEDLALICFTSGSTARPKAVMHTHAGLFRAARAFAETWHVTEQDRTIVCLPMAWAFGLVTTSMTTLVAGGTVLALARAHPERIVHAMADGATFFAGVTSIYARLVEYVDQMDEPPSHALRLCISGGEPRNEAVFGRWTATTGVPVHDNYAASECFPVITYDPLVDRVPRRRSAGKVVPGAHMRVVDPEGHDVSPGQAGEAWWKGPAQFIGYWGDPAQTEKATTPDGWYRTSDLVRVDDEGYVFVEGRLTDMIIRSGSNVSPSEVETVLRSHPSVADAAVIGVPDERTGQRVVAVLVGREDHVDVDELLAFCRTTLAGYKVPGQVIVTDALPISPATGKVDRKALAASLTS